MSMREIEMIRDKTANALLVRFVAEFDRLAHSTAFNADTDSVAVLIRVTLENCAKSYDYGDSATLRKLRKV